MVRLSAAPHAAEAAVNTITPSRNPCLASVALGQAPEDQSSDAVDDRVAVEHP